MEQQTGSHLSGDNLPFIEDLYGQYLQDPESIDSSWIPVFQEYFGIEFDGSGGRAAPQFVPRSLFAPATVFGAAQATKHSEAEYADLASQGFTVRTPERSTKFAARVRAIVRAYRLHGHLTSKIDPLGRPHAGEPPPELDPERYGIRAEDMDTPVLCEALFGNEEVTLQRVMDRLQMLYCGHIATEFQNIPDNEPRSWLRKQIEINEYAPIAGAAERVKILDQLTDAEAFEDFLHKKYVGAKRFSLSGGDALIPMMHAVLQEGGKLGVGEVIIGMAHRGRLNVLHNVMGKPARAMLSEFEKNPSPEDYLGSSDVKYHMGFSSDYEVEGSDKHIHLSLCFNPSHLEFVNPVVAGRTKAKQDRPGNGDGKRQLLPMLLHGDAAFSGQGIVAETLQMGGLRGYDLGGTIHIVINNQVGFTADPRESRSTTYATDIAKLLEIPIFHVNGHDPEACVRVAKLAMRYRQRFGQDVVIDLVCFRQYGHNEGDEPRFTQPLMYRKIEDVGPVRAHYVAQLIADGVIDQPQAQAMLSEKMDAYGEAFEQVRQTPDKPTVSSLDGVWQTYKGGDVDVTDQIETTVSVETLQQLGHQIATIPDHVKAHRTIKRLFKNRMAMANGELPIDWGFAESLAFATLAAEDVPIRISGQDSIRGTFNHRQAAVTDGETGEKYWPIRTVGNAAFDVYNSMLSEAGVLGFEYGYSLDYPDALIAWEAQFGDFANGAQVIIDQFISSGEDKWQRLSGLVMLLPHGYEGQGPEHSSARLERFLQLSAEHNWFVCNLTLPGQYFHVLRRQVHHPTRKPLVIMTPKSLLRLREATSSLEDLSSGGFQPVIPETRALEASKVKRVLLCSGKIYYELMAHAQKHERDDVAIVRVEQLYPLSESGIRAAIGPYEGAELVWVQEEPKNMGAWAYMFETLYHRMQILLKYAGRVASASPATGFKEAHEIEQNLIMTCAFGDDIDSAGVGG